LFRLVGRFKWLNVSDFQSGALAKRKCERLDAWVEEFDFHRLFANGARKKGHALPRRQLPD